jgi:hypothetical protein
MAQTLAILGDIFAEPSAAFLVLKMRPRWGIAAAFICLVTIGLSIRLMPYSTPLIVSRLGNAAEQESLRRMFDAAQRFYIAGSLFAPVPLILKWVAASTMLYSLAILANAPEMKFRTTFAIVVHAEMILLLMGLVNLSLLTLHGTDSIHTFADLNAIPGVLSLVNPETLGLPVIKLLGGLNPFSAWYLFLLTLGISIATGFGRLKSLVLVISVWLIGEAFQMLTLYAFSGT